MAEEFRGYSGTAYSPAGDKGRFVLPPIFRNAVKLSSDGRTLCLIKHDRWPCLVGFGLSRTQEFEAQIDKEEDAALKAGRDYDRDFRSLQLNGFSNVTFDDSGRFLMPDYLREMGAVEDGIFFQGAGRFFTLWAPEALYAMGPEFEPSKVVCRAHVVDAEAKGKGK